MRVVFRTKGSHSQGMGDVWSSLALAAECPLDDVLFILSGGDEAAAVVKENGYLLEVAETADKESEVLQAFSPHAIIVNKLNNPPAYIRSLKDRAPVVVTIDDAGTGGELADLQFNVLYHTQGAYVEPEYIALRREFQEMNGLTRMIRPGIRELLITQGGSDTYGFTPRIIKGLKSMRCRPHCTVVLGPAFRHEVELAEAVRDSILDLRIVRDARNMAQLMWEADLAISAGGITLFELACIGIPALAVCGERFELETASRLEALGTVINLGFGGDLKYERLATAVDELDEDVPRRRRMGERGKRLVDGKGSGRIMTRIRDYVLKKSLVA